MHAVKDFWEKETLYVFPDLEEQFSLAVGVDFAMIHKWNHPVDVKISLNFNYIHYHGLTCETTKKFTLNISAIFWLGISAPREPSTNFLPYFYWKRWALCLVCRVLFTSFDIRYNFVIFVLAVQRSRSKEVRNCAACHHRTPNQDVRRSQIVQDMVSIV